MTAKASWALEEGDEIASGRSVLRPLGGGHDYEVDRPPSPPNVPQYAL